MQLVELYLQGVAGLPPRVRLPLGGGHVAVRSDVPLLPLIEGALYGTGGPSAGRAALLVRSPDGNTYRLVREFPGGCVVQRLDEAARRFVELEGLAGSDFDAFLRTQLGAPSRQAFADLLSFSAPSAAPSAPVRPADLESAAARLEEELKLADRIDALQRQLDDRAHEQAALQREGNALSAAEGRVTRAQAELSRFEVLGDLPDDLGPTLVAWGAAERERDLALDRIAAERASFDVRLRDGKPAPLWKDLRFVAACVIGLAALGAGMFTPLHILALLNVPAFGAAAALGVRWVGQLQAVDAAGRMAALFAERERKVGAAWEAATTALRAAMERAGVQSAAALQEQVKLRAAAKAEVAEAVAERDAMRERHAPVAARLEGLQRESAELEIQMTALAAGAWRPRALVEAELAALRGHGDAPLAARIPEALLQKPAGEDRAKRMLAQAASLAGLDADALGSRLATRVSQYLAALTDERWKAVEITAAAGLRCEGLAWSELLDHDRTLALLSLQLALIEAVGTRHRLPVVYDDPFGFLDDAHQQQLGRMLLALGKRVQVIHRTSSDAMVACADAVAEFA